jgi:hypothetical protein
MKKLFVACFLLMLTSCIEVDNFGDYWDKATIDPTLAGKWQKISEEDEVTPTGQSWVFAVKDGSYEVHTFMHGKPADDDGPMFPVRTITVGPYKFLANGPEQGSMVRYTLEGDEAVFLVLEPKATWAFIKKNFPGQDSFYKGDPEDTPDEMDQSDEPMKIDTFTDQTFKILSSIPDTEVYWEADTLLKKVK